jgi:hypothetical protein
MSEHPVLEEVKTPRFQRIADILAMDLLSREILRFLLDNESAMDTVKGVAAWWVRRDELAVQPSLHHLFSCGVVQAYSLTSGATLYALTKDPETRAWLRTAFGTGSDARADNETPNGQRVDQFP